MHGYARLTFGPGFQPLRAALYYAQRLVTAPRLRQGLAHGIAAAIGRRHASQGAPGPLAAARLDRLRQEGLVGLEGFAPPAVVAEILAQLAAAPLVLPDGRECRPDAVPAGTALAAYPLESVLRCPAVIRLINDPALLDLVARYLGCTPTLSSLGIRWSFPSGTPGSAVQRFHRDPDDWRFLKLFVYLTDVDPESGPHVFVRGSHRTAGQLRARPYSAPEVERLHGPGAALAVTGPAGTSFLADTYGIHRGMVPTLRPRLILQAQYSLLPVFAFRYDPVTVTPRPDVDRYVNRLLLAE